MYIEKSSYIYMYMLGSELWECQFDGLLGLVKEYIYCRCEGNTKTNNRYIVI